MKIEKFLKKRDVKNLIVIHTSSIKLVDAECYLVDCHNQARDMAYRMAKENDLKCECMEDQPDVISGHIIVINHNGCYSAIVIDKKTPFSKKEIDMIPGVRLMPRHWTERSSKQLKRRMRKAVQAAS